MNHFKYTIVHLLIFTLPLTLCPVVMAENQAPGELVVSTIERGLKILQDPSLQGIDQAGMRKKKLWDEISAVFDFEETSRRALGHYWQDRTPDEQKNFTDVFVDILKELYLDKSDSYSGEKIEFVREIVKGPRSKVRTNFYTSDLKKVEVDFSMHKEETGWKVYDVTIEGVSMVSNYRSQFNSVLSENSFEQLMEKLIEKRTKFAE